MRKDPRRGAAEPGAARDGGRPIEEGPRLVLGAGRPSSVTPAPRVLSAATSRLTEAPLTLRVALSVVFLACVGVVDAATGFEISVSVFYLAPVLLAGGIVSRRAGRAMSVASAVTWGILDVAAGHQYSVGWIPIWNSVVRLAFFLIVNELFDSVRLSRARERELARTDSLTGIANRRVFLERAEQAIAQSRRSGRAFTLTYVDLDRFKQVNDRFGHGEGDRLLRAVAAVIAGHLRDTDVVARLGGDEFGVLMAETDLEAARSALGRIASSLALCLGERWGAGATLGAVTFTRAPDDVDFALRLADALMYRGKAAGRGGVLQETWPGPSLEEG